MRFGMQYRKWFSNFHNMKPSENKVTLAALKFFRWFCRPELLEELEGDLSELFQQHIKQYGLQKAKWLYIKEVLLMFRPAITGNFLDFFKKNTITMLSQNKRATLIFMAAPILLLVPLIAMQFTTEVRWNFFDFLVMGVLLLATGLLCEIVLRKIKTTKNRIIACGVVLFVFFLVWAELAVGIFGTPIAGS